MNAHDILVEARHKIIQYGWIKGDFRTRYGYCLVGAVNAASGGRLHNRKARRQALRVLRGTLGTWCVMHWNDRYATSTAEVLSVLEYAITMTAPKPKPTQPKPAKPKPYYASDEKRDKELVNA